MIIKKVDTSFFGGPRGKKHGFRGILMI